MDCVRNFLNQYSICWIKMSFSSCYKCSFTCIVAMNHFFTLVLSPVFTSVQQTIAIFTCFLLVYVCVCICKYTKCARMHVYVCFYICRPDLTLVSCWNTFHFVCWEGVSHWIQNLLVTFSLSRQLVPRSCLMSAGITGGFQRPAFLWDLGINSEPSHIWT